MQRSRLAAVGVLLVACAAALAAPADYKDLSFPPLREQSLPDIARVELPNGMLVLLCEDHELPLIDVSAMIGTGSAWEPPETLGLADLTGEVMRTGGTARMTGDEIDAALERIAASVETGIGVTAGHASLSALKEHFDTALAILADVLMRPAFAPEKIELAKLAAHTAISRRNDDPREVSGREYAKLIYGPRSPYARHPEHATIDAIARDDMVAFHRRFFTPDNCIIGVWGDFEKEAMRAKLEKAFAAWPRGAGPMRVSGSAAGCDHEASVNLARKDEMHQAYVTMGHVGGLLSDRDRPALIVMNTILGGSPTSRLFTTVRSRMGLAYSVRGSYGAGFNYPGLFIVSCQTKSESAIVAINAMRREIERIIAEPVTDEELAKAKDYYLNTFVFRFDTTGEVLARALEYEYHGYPPDFLQREREGVARVTKEDVMRAAAARLRPDKLQILVVGNPEKFDAPLSSLGEVRAVDIAIPEPAK